MNPTSFAWNSVGGYPFPPPSNDYASGGKCWLCGGETRGIGWPVRVAFSETFTDHRFVRCPESNAVCQPCVAMSKKITWDRYVAEHPEQTLKTGHALAWYSYSHVFWRDGHVCPRKSAMKGWLLSPPDPPFLMVFTATGRKHLIFRSKVGVCKDAYPVQLEEESIFLDRERFLLLLSVWDRLRESGFSRDAILTGQYLQEPIKKCGLNKWLELENEIRPWRRQHPDWLRLAHFVSVNEDVKKGE